MLSGLNNIDGGELQQEVTTAMKSISEILTEDEVKANVHNHAFNFKHFGFSNCPCCGSAIYRRDRECSTCGSRINL